VTSTLDAAGPLDRFLVAPRRVPPLDPGFRPASLARAAFEASLGQSSARVPVTLAVEQPGGIADTRETWVLPAGDPGAAASHAFCERLAKSMLWAFGGFRIWVDGPAALVAHLRRHYADSPTGRFDATTLGETVFGRPFEIEAAGQDEFPSRRVGASRFGGHLDGCRIGFDLGASDRKAAALIDGEVVFSEEVAWDPARHADPQWHFDQIMDSLHRAAAHLPRVDAIGGSAAGVYVDNEIRVASLFRSVPPDVFRARVPTLFGELQAAWGGIPFVVLNDGDVTALAGAMVAKVGGLLGIAMGSSEAAGYITPDGRLTSWLNELAFVPIDLAADAAVDDWSGDRGCGSQYFSQQALRRLLPAAGIEVEADAALPDQVLSLQALVAGEDARALGVYETIGTELGYALLEYRTLYDIENVLLLGRLMSGAGGDVVTASAIEALRAEDPAAAERVMFHEVSERDKRHGQAVAAASLPTVSSGGGT
jgi:predicted NBD/HSP70 family sugar kinase